jgi:hypothetical protein
MAGPSRESALERIRTNIERYGYHVYTVTGGGQLPRYVYTIGLSERIGSELIFAGAIFFMGKEATRIIDTIAKEWDSNKASYTVESLGRFSVREADLSWSGSLMLGAVDYYKNTSIRALQIIPEPAHWTVDIPDMRKPWSAAAEPVWQWMHEPWTHPVPAGSTAVTDLAALRGERVTEAARWEEDEWELFAGEAPEVPKDEVRIVPLGTLLGADPSLLPVTTLTVGGRGLLRDADEGEWEPWESSNTPED